MATRDYRHVNFPLHVSHWKQGFALGYITPHWDALPVPLRRKINDAYTGNHELVITKDDLDSLPEALWVQLEPHLGQLG